MSAICPTDMISAILCRYYIIF